MATYLTDEVQELAEARGVTEAEILEQALERGVEDLWVDLVLSRYVNEEIDRETAIDRVGRDRDSRLDQPAASEFGVDDRSKVEQAADGDQATLFADTADDQQTLTGEDAAARCPFEE